MADGGGDSSRVDGSDPEPETIDFGSPESTATLLGTEPYNPRKAEDAARRNIAYALIIITAAIIFGGFVLAAWALSADAPINENLKTVLALLNVVFGPIIALLGSATGFYFGANAAAKANATGR